MDSSAYILDADSPANSERSSVHSCSYMDDKKGGNGMYYDVNEDEEYNNSVENVNVSVNEAEIFVNKFMFYKIQALDIIEDK